MKVFISWSGTTSHRVAVLIRDWLPSVIQSIEPYVSSEDIDKGTRWSTDIAGELHASSYGIIWLTKDNILAPWINFEAGALGKSIDKSKVSPFLFRVKRSEVAGPILQFQSTILEKDDVLKLLKSINSACGQDALDIARLEKAFNIWWPQLEKQLNEIPEDEITAEEHKESSQSDIPSKIIEEILELTRNNHRLLRDPSAILPAEYVQHVLRRPNRRDESTEIRGFEGRIHPDAIRDILETYQDILKFIAIDKHDLHRNPEMSELIYLLNQLDAPLRYISKQMGLRLPRESVINNDAF